MIMDEYNEFADAASVVGTASPTTALVGDVIDLGAVPRDIGNGQPVYLVITTGTEIITAGSAGTIEFMLASDDAAAIATDGSATIHWRSQAFVTDDAGNNSPQLNAGGVIACVALPLEGAVYERYLGILVTRTTTATTAGTINAFLTLDPTGWRAYPDAAN